MDELQTPDVSALAEVVGVLGEWQSDEAPWQIHPGDLGWFWRLGDEATAGATRVWRRDGRIVGVGLLDGEDLLRMTVAPDLYADPDLAERIAADVVDPARGVLGTGEIAVEAPVGLALHDRLDEHGWGLGEPWQPLRRGLAEPVEDPGVRVVTVDESLAADRVAVQREAFGRSTFTPEKWVAMTATPAYAGRARCLLAYDGDDPAAIITVWSAGEGRPGVVEPMGVHQGHRGRGLGRAVCLAGAAALRELGASTALVYTPSANVGGVATYDAAGFERLPEVRDRVRPALG